MPPVRFSTPIGQRLSCLTIETRGGENYAGHTGLIEHTRFGTPRTVAARKCADWRHFRESRSTVYQLMNLQARTCLCLKERFRGGHEESSTNSKSQTKKKRRPMGASVVAFIYAGQTSTLLIVQLYVPKLHTRLRSLQSPPDNEMRDDNSPPSLKKIVGEVREK